VRRLERELEELRLEMQEAAAILEDLEPKSQPAKRHEEHPASTPPRISGKGRHVQGGVGCGDSLESADAHLEVARMRPDACAHVGQTPTRSGPNFRPPGPLDPEITMLPPCVYRPRIHDREMATLPPIPHTPYLGIFDMQMQVGAPFSYKYL
jgi:hypothetical protein